jgi:ferredoxin
LGRPEDSCTLRRIGGLEVRIDRDLCVGFGDCITAAPDAFELDGDGVAVFLRPQTVSRGQLLAACASCPVDAITVHDENGDLLVP